MPWLRLSIAILAALSSLLGQRTLFAQPQEPSLDDICKIDPQACPTLDMTKEAARPYQRELYAVSQSSFGSVPSKVWKRFVMPSGTFEAGGELAFVTSDAGLTEQALKLTDLALLRPRARRSFGRWFELHAGTSLLVKQPGEADEPLWQGASLGVVLEASPGYAATLDAAAGPLFGAAGRFWQTKPGLAAKWSIHSAARLLLGISSVFTKLDAEGGAGSRAWIEELGVSGEAQLGDRPGAFWIAAEYRLPLAYGGLRPGAPTPVAIDPPVCLSLEFGGVLTFSHLWDLFATYSIVDRGELDDPASTLPILDRGFDQQQLVFGVQHRFVPDPEPLPR